MATLYSKDGYNSYSGVHYRTKCDYSTSTSDTSTTLIVSYSVLLQSYGFCQSDNDGAYTDTNDIRFAQAVAHFVGESGLKTNAYMAGINQDSSTWRNLPPTKSGSITFTRETSAVTKSLLVTVINGVARDEATYAATVNITIPALASKTVTYDANGGTGAPAAGKKYYSKTYTISNVEPTRTGYVFSHWNTKADNSGTSFQSGGSYTVQADLKLYAIWNPVIYYDGNGAVLTGFDSQTKTYGTNLTLRSTTPTREGYVFEKWNTAANGSGTDYSPGGTYTANTTATLYAQWLALPAAPQITSMTAVRCNAGGTEENYGNYAKITVTWSVDTTSVVYPNNTGAITGRLKPQGGTESSFSFTGDTSGTGGTATAIISADTDTQYIVTAIVTDLNTSSSRAVLLTRAHYTLDFKAGGVGVGIGRAAPDAGLEIGYETQFDEDIIMLANAYMDISTTDALYTSINSLGWTSEVIAT